ncbi:Transcriptional regulator, TetR family [Frankia sp. AiPs1]|uniref:TetR/AcrR family transcriptional regulator n=1 Tax=Frankia sp. AiPa1 TaxID=573492 RepID=UPI00202B2501|nr:helix-turn-helix domain-containing protein [Frankia sp. AiPa1]MCL9761688.1 TetR family transcriptional regulator [Frankia sp. AiPa1]
MSDGRRRDAARSRQALLTAAAGLFAERGYAGTAIRSVGDRAGVDPALIARYFGGKEGLYRAVLAADPLIESVHGQGTAPDGHEPGEVQVSPTAPGSAPPVSPAPSASSARSESSASTTSAARASGTARASATGVASSEAAGSSSAGSGLAGSEPDRSLPDGPRAEIEALVGRALDRWITTGTSVAAQNVFRREIEDAVRAATRERFEPVLGSLHAVAVSAGASEPGLAAEIAVALLFGVGVARDAGTLSRLSGAGAGELTGPLVAALTAALGVLDRPDPTPPA